MGRGRSINSGERHRVKELMRVSHGGKNAEVFYSMTSERGRLGKQQDVSALETERWGRGEWQRLVFFMQLSRSSFLQIMSHE